MPRIGGCVGIDVSKDRLDVAILGTGEVFVVDNDSAGWAVLVDRLKKLDAPLVGLEASGGYERDVIHVLCGAGLDVRRIMPGRVRQFARAAGVRAKNDRIDADLIARFVATMPTRPVEIDPEGEKLAELVTARRQLLEDLTSAQNQAAGVASSLLRRMARRRMASLKASILLLDKHIAAMIASHPEFAHRDALMRSVPGVGPVLSATLIAGFPELGSLSNRQCGALLGVVPYDHDSGKFKGKRTIWGGRMPIRNVVYMAAIVAGNHNPVLASFKRRLLANGKLQKVAIVAVMRKLIILLNAILRDDKPWSPAPQ